MAYGLTELETRAESITTTLSWEFNFCSDIMGSINDRKTTNPCLFLSINESTDPEKGRKQEVEYSCQALLIKPYALSSTDKLGKKLDTVKALLKTFIFAYADRTTVALTSSISFVHEETNKDQNAEIWVLARFKINVTNC